MPIFGLILMRSRRNWADSCRASNVYLKRRDHRDVCESGTLLHPFPRFVVAMISKRIIAMDSGDPAFVRQRAATSNLDRQFRPRKFRRIGHSEEDRRQRFPLVRDRIMGARSRSRSFVSSETNECPDRIFRCGAAAGQAQLPVKSLIGSNDDGFKLNAGFRRYY